MFLSSAIKVNFFIIEWSLCIICCKDLTVTDDNRYDFISCDEKAKIGLPLLFNTSNAIICKISIKNIIPKPS